ncbi:hypothetical protein LBMAG57_25940 [Verrucomicrobiota bacterium]|nr:hypothetical protein LBMAG57_25940 [Verrucomicrobiota bacterium]
MFPYVGQQAEVVLLNRDLPAAGLKLALAAVPVQDEVGWRRVGEERGDFFEALPRFADQGRGLHLERGVVVAVDDFPEADFALQRFRQGDRIEGQQEFVVLAQLVGEDEADGDELGRIAPAS